MRVLYLTIIALLLTACSETTFAPRQLDCMDDGYVSYGGECVGYFDVPIEDREDVLVEVADEIAERDGITRDEAIEWMYDTLLEMEEGGF